MEPVYPRLGALPQGDVVRFHVRAPAARRVEVVLEPAGTPHPLAPAGAGYWEGVLDGVPAGGLYRYRLDGERALPDPASRFQPEGVHGPSMVVDPRAFRWHDADWPGRAQDELIFYELHVGTFSPEGTFEGVRRRLSYLRDLGVTAVELMPVAEFPGRRNWGYDPAAFFAPSSAYGAPDDLRALVDDAHRLGLAVFLDVVYNHFGPEGAYAPAFNPDFFSTRHRTPWGPALNFDGPESSALRSFFIENALHWLVEYHLDGLRLDATHTLLDESPTHFLAELAGAVRALPGRSRYLVPEDNRNQNRLILPPAQGGYGLDAVWSDDYHHQIRVLLAGDRDGYFGDFGSSTRDLATIIRQGWLYTGQYASFFQAPRGTDPRGIPLWRFVHFIQNHDQVANRPRGERLTAQVSLAAFRAATALLLFAPGLPLLFMGQEWAAGTPFLYFTDHTPELGRRVRAGRRRESAKFSGLSGEIPDPQDPATFLRSRLDWAEPAREPHAAMHRLVRDLLRRRAELAGDFAVESPVEGGLMLRRGRHHLLVALRDDLHLPRPPGTAPGWHTEESRYAPDPQPPEALADAVYFPRAAALALEAAR